jgi:hypothetical protein
MKDNKPTKGSAQWVRNEKIINSNPALKQMRDTAEGLSSRGENYLGAPSQEYKDGWEKIFGKKKNESKDDT